MLHTIEIELEGNILSIETGRMAKQADGAVFVQYKDTAVIATAVAKKKPNKSGDFLPLTVNYFEKAYAAGKFPGGFFKREGKPSDRETLIARLIDRPTRPLFPKKYFYETQVCCIALSADMINDPDVLAITGASAALLISGIPISSAFAGVRVGLVDEKFVLNPTYEQIGASSINIVVAGTADAVTMVEGAAKEIPEDVILKAINFAHGHIKKIIPKLEELAAKVGKPAMKWEEPEKDEELAKWTRERFKSQLGEAVSLKEKQERSEAIGKIGEDVPGIYKEENNTEEELSETQLKTISQAIQEETKHIMRASILETGVRVDGRSSTEIRPITCELNVLPRAHGSALFTRGETQALVVVTLGTSSDAQRIDTLEGESSKTFMLHYNFPPFSVGEVGFMRGPGRREIGHGNLAERALIPVIPSPDDFLYSIRIVSEILESNGSSSMASVCGGSLALMDAGVSIKDSVAGIAMGLIKEGDKTAILSDILGLEDHLGDMDFKITGTRQGITAIQMDIKITGLPDEIMQKALEQALQGRLYILDKMKEGIVKPRLELSEHAPRIVTTQVKSGKIGEVIGPGGKTIRGIIEKTGVKIDIDDSGKVTIASVDKNSAEEALDIVRKITEEPEIDKIYKGTVKRIMDFGAFVEILPGTVGLLHISQIANERVNKVEDYVKEGDQITVKCVDIDRAGKLRLVLKGIPQE